MKRVAVTGASGHIGANLVRELLDRQYDVVTLIRESSLALDGLSVHRVQGDVLDLKSLCGAFKGAEHVYHLAALISMQSSDKKKLESINIEGTRNVIEACRLEGVSTLIHFSSIHVFDQQQSDQEVNEASTLISRDQRHGDEYGYTKAQADHLVREQTSAALNTIVIYPTAVLGPNDFNLSLFGQAILKMAQGRLPALVAGGYNWVDARDVARAAVNAAQTGLADDRYIFSGHFLSMPEVAQVIADLTGSTPPKFTCPIWLAKLSAPLMGLWARLHGETPLYTRTSLSALSASKPFSHAHATEMLGYQPRPFRDSMRDALQFYTEQKRWQAKPDGD